MLRIATYWIVTTFLTLSFNFGHAGKGSKYLSHKVFRKVEVGKVARSYVAWTQDEKGQEVRIVYNSKKLSPSGEFFVMHVSDKYSFNKQISCFDLGCGQGAESVVKRGGHIHGSTDHKAARSCGLRLDHSRSDRVFDTSLMIVTDKKGIVIGIYEKAVLGDLEGILSKHFPEKREND